MIQKKVCMVGVAGAGKTSLVRRFVQSIFADRYQSTVGVKIDRKTVSVDGTEVNLLLWDLAGRGGDTDISPSYVRGAHGILYVVDGTRRETAEQVYELREIVRGVVGEVPALLAMNKIDLTDQWALAPTDEAKLAAVPFHLVRTSAKTGQGVEDAFSWLARATHGAGR